MSKKEPRSKDAPFTEKENSAIEKLFKDLYNQPIHFQFRASIRFMKKNNKKGIVALSPHYIGLFVPKGDGNWELLKVDVNGSTKVINGLIHVLYIRTIYLGDKDKFVYFTVQHENYSTNVTCKGNQCARFGQLLYRNIKFTFSSYKIDIQSDKKDELLPELKFECDNPDFNKRVQGNHENVVVSPSQKFQFAYFANSTHYDDKYLFDEKSSTRASFNQEVVRFLHNLILSSNSIIDISQLPLELSSNTSSENDNSKGKKNKDDENGKGGENGEGDENGKSGENGEGDENGKSGENGEGDENGKSGENGEGDENGKGGENGEGDNNGKGSKSGKSDKNNKKENEKYQSNDATDLLPIFLSLNKTDFIAGICARNMCKRNIIESVFSVDDDDPTKSDNLIALNQNLRIIHFESCNAQRGLKGLSDAIDKTNEFKVEYWNLSGNHKLDFKYFHNIISRSTYPIKYLNLANCKIKPDKSAQIFKALSENENVHKLQFLIYPGNDPFDSACKSSFESLINVISKRNSELKYVDFSFMTIEDFTTVLQKISSLPIETLVIRGFKMGKESSPLSDLHVFIRNSSSLKKLDLSDMKIEENTHDNLSEIIKWIARNPNLSKFELCLNNLKLHDDNILILFRSFLTNPQTEKDERRQSSKTKKGSNAEINEHSGLSKWKSLSFDSNGMKSDDLANLIPLFRRMKNLEELSFNDNFNHTMQNIENNLKDLLNISSQKRPSKNSLNLKKLSIAGTPGKVPEDPGNFLKSSLSNVLLEMDNVACSQLEYLDISCNHARESIVGPIKKLLHSKSVHIKTLLFDENFIPSIKYLDELANAADDCESLITFPFPINDAKYIIKQTSSTERQNVINELSEIQIKFIKVVNKHRKALHIKDDLPFPADGSVKELVEDILDEVRNEKGRGDKQYLKLHTKFCHEFHLPLPFQRMPNPGTRYDDETPIDQIDEGKTNIGDMEAYERKEDDDPYYNAVNDNEEIPHQEELSTFYIEKDQGSDYITTGTTLTNNPAIFGGDNGDENASDDGAKTDPSADDGGDNGDDNKDNSNSKEETDSEGNGEKPQNKGGKDSTENPKGGQNNKDNSNSEEETDSEEEYKKSSKKGGKGSTKKPKRGRGRKNDSDEETDSEEEEYKKSSKKGGKGSTKKPKRGRGRRNDSDEETDSEEEEYKKSSKKGGKGSTKKPKRGRGRRYDSESESSDEEEETPKPRRTSKNRKGRTRGRQDSESSESYSDDSDYGSSRNKKGKNKKSVNKRSSKKKMLSENSSDSDQLNGNSSSSVKRRNTGRKRTDESSTSSDSWSDPRLITRYNDNSSDDYIRSSSSSRSSRKRSRK